MALGSAVGSHMPELSADFQRFYGMTVRAAVEENGATWASDLAANMPRGSALYAAVEPDSKWSDAEYLLAQLDYDVRVLTWAMTGGKRSKKPKPVRTPGQVAKDARAINKVDEEKMREVAAALGITKAV